MTLQPSPPLLPSTWLPPLSSSPLSFSFPNLKMTPVLSEVIMYIEISLEELHDNYYVIFQLIHQLTGPFTMQNVKT